MGVPVALPLAAPARRVALISITTRCNANCSFCCVRDTLNRPELDPSDEWIEREMSAARSRGSTVLSFTGGEPTAHARFVELCRRGRELGFQAVTINTNGIRFQNRGFAERALEAGLSHVDFSIHGHTPELHDTLVERPGALDALLAGLRHLRELSRTHGVVLGATTVLTRKNAPELPAIAEFLTARGFSSIRFKHAFEGAPGADPALVGSYAALAEPLREAVAVARRNGACVELTHVPLCLLGDDLVCATDLGDEDVRSVHFGSGELADGRASQHRRSAAAACATCLAAGSCSGLDARYLEAFDGSEIEPFVDPGALAERLERGLARHDLGEGRRKPVQALVARLRTEAASSRVEGAGGGAASSAAPKERSHSRRAAEPGSAGTGTGRGSERSAERGMRIGFISPSFRMLEVDWQSDFEMVKLGVPTLMGYLCRAGHSDIRHWDFDAQICEALENDPGAFDMKRYFDGEAVRAFLEDRDEALRPQTERLLDTLGVDACDVYGISLAAVLDRIDNVCALAAVAQCLAKVLKERHPRAFILLGGLQVNPDSLQPDYYRRFLQECSAIDGALIGKGDQTAVQFLRNLARGDLERCRRLDRVILRDESGALVAGRGDESAFDPDLTATPVLHQLHHPAHTKRGAAAQAEAAVRRAAELAERTTPAPAPIPYEATHGEDAREIAADVAGAQPYASLPAVVPVFDPELVNRFRFTGFQIMKRFGLDRERLLNLSRFDGERIVVLPHIFVRGCNAPCGFCAYAYRPIEGEDIIQTVEGLKFLAETYDCRHFHFLNTQINSVYAYCEAFCDAVIAAKLDILWSDCCNMRALDERLLEKMRRAGAVRLVYGVESPEDEMLRYIRKGVTVDKIERLVKAAHSVGIWNHVLLIAGMPHETREKQDRMMDFLERTSSYIDFYTVSSFYLIASSPWGKEPEKFGIERISAPDRLLEEQAFNENAAGRWSSDNLRWPEKKQQIVESTRRFYRTLSRAKGHSRCVSGNIDLYLLMFLYRTLGHARKDEIARLYVERAKKAAPVEPGTFRITVPLIIQRANEADQSSLAPLPLTVRVRPRSDDPTGFVHTSRFSFAYARPSELGDGDEGHVGRSAIKSELPSAVGRLGRLIEPFLRALEAKLSPETPERMAELAARNLGRYRPFLDSGHVVEGPTEGRTLEQRTLDWAGHGRAG
ncbi:MAG TPA: radical SAM protein [Polyangiaceae bacterium]